MGLLVLAGLIWLGLHIGVAGTRLRGVIVSAIGERTLRGVFALASLAAIAFLIFAYNRADTWLLWAAPGWLVGLLDVAMLAACVLFVGSLSLANPTMAGTEGGFGQEPHRMFRATRHPMLCAFAIWACVHLIANGDTASLVFFGTFLVTVLAGIPSIDAKLARRDPAKWATLTRTTSAVPFVAILAGRNRFASAEIGWRPPLLGLLLWAVLLGLHPALIGVPALPR
jgi:uncharacterized membrane protein